MPGPPQAQYRFLDLLLHCHRICFIAWFRH